MAAMAAMFGGAKKAMLNKTKTKVTPNIDPRTKTLGKLKSKGPRQKLKKVSSRPRDGLAPWVKKDIKAKRGSITGDSKKE